jgi:hypothetical protein
VDQAVDVDREKESAAAIWRRYRVRVWGCANVSARAGMCLQAMLFPSL